MHVITIKLKFKKNNHYLLKIIHNVWLIKKVLTSYYVMKLEQRFLQDKEIWKKMFQFILHCWIFYQEHIYWQDLTPNWNRFHHLVIVLIFVECFCSQTLPKSINLKKPQEFEILSILYWNAYQIPFLLDILFQDFTEQMDKGFGSQQYTFTLTAAITGQICEQSFTNPLGPMKSNIILYIYYCQASLKDVLYMYYYIYFYRYAETF